MAVSQVLNTLRVDVAKNFLIHLELIDDALIDVELVGIVELRLWITFVQITRLKVQVRQVSGAEVDIEALELTVGSKDSYLRA